VNVSSLILWDGDPVSVNVLRVALRVADTVDVSSSVKLGVALPDSLTDGVLEALNVDVPLIDEEPESDRDIVAVCVTVLVRRSLAVGVSVAPVFDFW
jgi:hypothetical protein